MAVGARKAFCEMNLVIIVINNFAGYPILHNSQRNASFVRDATTATWGKDSRVFVKSLQAVTFERHHTIAKKSAVNYKYASLFEIC